MLGLGGARSERPPGLGCSWELLDEAIEAWLSDAKIQYYNGGQTFPHRWRLR